MTQVIEGLNKPYKNKILIKSMNTITTFLTISTQKQTFMMADLATYSVSIGIYRSWRTDQALSILHDIPETDPDYPSVLVVQSEATEKREIDLGQRKKLLKAKDLIQTKRLLIFTLEHYYLKQEVLECSAFFLERLKTKSRENWGRRTCTRIVR